MGLLEEVRRGIELVTSGGREGDFEAGLGRIWGDNSGGCAGELAMSNSVSVIFSVYHATST